MRRPYENRRDFTTRIEQCKSIEDVRAMLFPLVVSQVNIEQQVTQSMDHRTPEEHEGWLRRVEMSRIILGERIQMLQAILKQWDAVAPGE